MAVPGHHAKNAGQNALTLTERHATGTPFAKAMRLPCKRWSFGLQKTASDKAKGHLPHGQDGTSGKPTQTGHPKGGQRRKAERKFVFLGRTFVLFSFFCQLPTNNFRNIDKLVRRNEYFCALKQ